jgi:pyruvate/2-oxoacid:ferredoxin oxidoreductase beta subunit
MLVAATRQVHGPDSMGIVAATGCNTVYGSTYPFNPYMVPWTNSLFENAPAVALGVRARWDQVGHQDRRLWVIGGDGAMFDIGFQALSRMVASGADIKVLVLDTQVYSNTGGQASTASFGGQVTKLSAFGTALHGRTERRKELGRILAAHGTAYVAQTTPAHLNHCYRAIVEANTYPGPAVVIAYAPCQPEHGIPDDASMHQATRAVETRAFPLFTYDPRRGERESERWSLQGNPALREDWATAPTGAPDDFLAFARSEGRFAAHFSADGTPSAEILATREDRLANWRTLQELAGRRDDAGEGGGTRRAQRCRRGLVLDDERRDHPEHAVLTLGMLEDVAVEGPRAGLGALDDDVPALARVDAQGVARELGAAERVPVPRHDPHGHPVQVPRMHHVAFIHEPDDDRLPEVRHDRRRGREAASVDGEPAQRVVADPDDVLGRTILLVVPLGRVGRLDDERAEETASDLVGRVVVRVVHV